ncbi:transporter [Pseudomonas putida]|uniref:Transporter n=1 Tax=Pseudomonas putida TaxID=303 RepID=A0AA37RLP7_PSEPU|nr:AEC family transporter [Pseudomonas putida]GLO16191.1 transporter [Pseudomonas putida]GLO38046.1 transporter [Pseudomonas putida]HDS0965703.1 AEC family transporter [Pseudomonas putida]HDS0991975.1 AEC family transporter [Pseudomonas putida]
MLTTFFSVLPIFLLIVAGNIVKRWFINKEGWWKQVDKLVYYLFFPALLIRDISKADFGSGETSTAIFATVGATLVVGLIIFLGQAILKVRNDLFTSIFQGGIRYNSYVFIALAHSLYGAEGVAISGVFVAYLIITTNVMSVLVMNQFGEGGRKSPGSMLAALIKNPLIIGALVGLALNLCGVRIVGSVEQFMSYLGSAATPLSLMSVGAGLMLNLQVAGVLATLYVVVLKLLLLPVVTLALIMGLGVSGTAANVALLYACVPCAGNAYILARQMGGDAPAMASMITWTTLVSTLTITLIVSMVEF